jgi:hypothetical protein
MSIELVQLPEWIRDPAIIKAFGQYVVLPLLVFLLLKNPPKWTARYFIRKAKAFGAEIELEPIRSKPVRKSLPHLHRTRRLRRQNFRLPLRR